MSDSPPVPLRAAVVAVQLPGVDAQSFAASLAELRRLGRTLGVDVVATVTQRRQTLHPAALLGRGKLAELAALAGRTASHGRGGARRFGERRRRRRRREREPPGRSTTFPAPRTPPPASRRGRRSRRCWSTTRSRRRRRATWRRRPGVEVLDRTAVILEIFRRHARSRAAKAQVEIVRLQYLAPRLREQGKGKDRQRGGIGGKGAGRVEPGARSPQDPRSHRRADRASSSALDEERGPSAPAAAT